MVRKRISKIWTVCAVLLCLLLMGQTKIRGEETGSLTIDYHGKTIEEERTEIAGAEFLIYQVAIVKDGVMEKTEKFQDIKISFSPSTASKQLQQARDLKGFVSVQQLQEDHQITTDAQGQASLTGLAPGMYLVIQKEATSYGEGGFLSLPFLTELPMQTESGVSYHVRVEPKSEWVKETPTEPTKPADPTKPTDTQKPSKDSGTHTAPQTGDTSNIVLWGTISILSALVLSIVCVKRKKIK